MLHWREGLAKSRGGELRRNLVFVISLAQYFPQKTAWGSNPVSSSLERTTKTTEMADNRNTKDNPLPSANRFRIMSATPVPGAPDVPTSQTSQSTPTTPTTAFSTTIPAVLAAAATTATRSLASSPILSPTRSGAGTGPTALPGGLLTAGLARAGSYSAPVSPLAGPSGPGAIVGLPQPLAFTGTGSSSGGGLAPRVPLRSTSSRLANPTPKTVLLPDGEETSISTATVTPSAPAPILAAGPTRRSAAKAGPSPARSAAAATAAAAASHMRPPVPPVPYLASPTTPTGPVGPSAPISSRLPSTGSTASEYTLPPAALLAPLPGLSSLSSAVSTAASSLATSPAAAVTAFPLPVRSPSLVPSTVDMAGHDGATVISPTLSASSGSSSASTASSVATSSSALAVATVAANMYHPHHLDTEAAREALDDMLVHEIASDTPVTAGDRPGSVAGTAASALATSLGRAAAFGDDDPHRRDPMLGMLAVDAVDHVGTVGSGSDTSSAAMAATVTSSNGDDSAATQDLLAARRASHAYSLLMGSNGSDPVGAGGLGTPAPGSDAGRHSPATPRPPSQRHLEHIQEITSSQGVRTVAENMPKEDRNWMPRCTAHVTASKYRFPELITHLVTRHKVTVRAYDECIYASYPQFCHSPLIAAPLNPPAMTPPMQQYQQPEPTNNVPYTAPAPTAVAGTSESFEAPDLRRSKSLSHSHLLRDPVALSATDLAGAGGHVEMPATFMPAHGHGFPGPGPSRPYDLSLHHHDSSATAFATAAAAAAAAAHPIQPYGEVCFFEYGCVVMWGLTAKEEQWLLRELRQFHDADGIPRHLMSKPDSTSSWWPLGGSRRQRNEGVSGSNSSRHRSSGRAGGFDDDGTSLLFTDDLLEDEVGSLSESDGSYVTEEFNFQYEHLASGRPRIFNDIITLKNGNHMTKVVISHGIAQSCKLLLFEVRMDSTLDKTKHIPKLLAMTGNVHLSPSKITTLTGQLYRLRMDLTLVSNYLDQPDLVWTSPGWQPLYRAVQGYLEIENRSKTLNLRASVLSDLLDMLSSHVTSTQADWMTWVVIILITVDVIVLAMEIVMKAIKLNGE